MNDEPLGDNPNSVLLELLADDAEGPLLMQIADLLYEPGDPRREPWPAPPVLGRIRSWLRGLADQWNPPNQGDHP